jgi:hypothetical protein
MSTLTIALSEERLQKLEEIAWRFQIAPEEMVRVSIEELLSLPEDEQTFGWTARQPRRARNL